LLIDGSNSARRLFPRLLIGAATCVFALFLIPKLLRSPADEAFGWFGRLGFPDVAGRPYVKVATGGWSWSGNNVPQGNFTQGFLLSQSNETFTVFTKDLLVQTFHATASGTPTHERVG